MNAVEIEQAISELAEKECFDPSTFPFEFLRAYGYKPITIRRLQAGETNKSDVGGVLHVKYIHLAVSPTGDVSSTLKKLRDSTATTRYKARFVLATDGNQFEAEDLNTGETVACHYADFPKYFWLFLPIAGITTAKQIRENAFDIRATNRLKRLYVTLMQDNPEWGTDQRRPDMNHFMARLTFCFFAEDTGIFPNESRFTATVEQMSARDSSNTHEVIQTLFLAMNTRQPDRGGAGIPRWAHGFPYVNGGLFSGTLEVPRFSKVARAYLLHIGNLDWKQINPDIFGSMIQTVAEDEERGELGMHYTSVPNILKVLNPLFLDDLRSKFEDAGDNKTKLLNLRKRMARIRVFDPACGSGNFLVIAYKEMRAIEAEINRSRSEEQRRSELPLTNFRGIEIRDFAAEIARLALIIAEYQCDVLYRGPQLALAEFLPLAADNWITCENALRVDWLSLFPPTGTTVKLVADDLFSTTLTQAEINFENEGGETYICGNPPYKGSREQLPDQKSDLETVLSARIPSWKTLDYVAGWFMKAAEYGNATKSTAAFVTTNSICQGQHVPTLWSVILSMGQEIAFAHTSFKWQNLASHNAGVTVAVVGISRNPPKVRKIYSISDDGETTVRDAAIISPYLVASSNVIVEKESSPLADLPDMNYGNYPGDGNHLSLSRAERDSLILGHPEAARLIRPVYGAQEFIRGLSRYCLWIDDEDLDLAMSVPEIARRIGAVRETRTKSRDKSLNKLAGRAHQYRDRNASSVSSILIPTISSETRDFIPVDLKGPDAVTTNQAFALNDAPLWTLGILSSRLHLVWVATVCGRMKTDYRYSNTLGWNTFPVPKLTEKNKEDITRCAEGILLAREAHFPATIADLYDPEAMPADLKAAHERNDEVLERIYIGRRFRNDTERLEKLFELYTKMTVGKPLAAGKTSKKAQA